MRVITPHHSLIQSQQALPCLEHSVPTTQRGEAGDPESHGASVLAVTAALVPLVRVSNPHKAELLSHRWMATGQWPRPAPEPQLLRERWDGRLWGPHRAGLAVSTHEQQCSGMGQRKILWARNSSGFRVLLFTPVLSPASLCAFQGLSFPICPVDRSGPTSARLLCGVKSTSMCLSPKQQLLDYVIICFKQTI